jgi:hypothetical protein
MKAWRTLAVAFVAALCGSVGLAQYQSLHDQNETLLGQLQRVHGLTDVQMTVVRAV